MAGLTRYWGEERSDGAIYSVYLRKVRYHTPRLGGMFYIDAASDWTTAMNEPGSPGTVSHLQWETVKDRIIKAGTVKKLVECLITERGELNTRHFNVFFNTYRTFSTANEVLDHLTYIFNSSPQLPTSGVSSAKRNPTKILERKDPRYAIRSILGSWLELFQEDFEEEGLVAPPSPSDKLSPLNQLLEFTSAHMSHLADVYEKALKIQAHLKKSRKGSTRKSYAHRKLGIISTADDLEYIMDGHKHRLPDFTNMDAKYVADQLTYWDAELFKALIPYQCLGSLWNKRHKTTIGRDPVYSVRATVNQFNAITFRVISLILRPTLEPKTDGMRAKIVTKWIETLRELRLRKNYSSLKGILSALTCEPIYRLKNVWSLVPKGKSDELENLLRIFSEEHNSLGTREVLEKEGTAKTVMNGAAAQAQQTSRSSNAKPGRRNNRYHRTKSDLGEMQGTVPYLGTFLTDLTYLDAALPNKAEGDLINFEKRRKEFQVLVQIKLFQSAAHNYHIKPDPKFRAWFSQLPCFPESEWILESQAIEPQSISTPPLDKSKRFSKGSRSFGSLASLTQFFTDLSPNSANLGSDSRSSSPKTPHSAAPQINGSAGYGNTLTVSHKPPVSPYPTSQRSKQCGWAYGPFAPFGTCHFVASVPGRQNNSEFDASVFGYWMGGRPQKSPRKPSSLSCGEPCTKGTVLTVPDPKYITASDNTVSVSAELRGKRANSNTVRFSINSLDSLESAADNDQFRSTLPRSHHPHSDTTSNDLDLSANFDDCDDDAYIVRVSLDPKLYTNDVAQTNMYKCIKLDNSDKTHTLIAKALSKHQIDGCPSDFRLVQQLPNGKELNLPDSANAYYAVAHTGDLRIIYCTLKPKHEHQSASIRDLKRRKKPQPAPRSNLLRWNSSVIL